MKKTNTDNTSSPRREKVIGAKSAGALAGHDSPYKYSQKQEQTMNTRMKMVTDILSGITSPSKVGTRLGTLKFLDGFPDETSVEKLYDNFDLLRAVQVYFMSLPPVSVVGLREELTSGGQLTPLSRTSRY
jgi:hypothetical protein